MTSKSLHLEELLGTTLESGDGNSVPTSTLLNNCNGKGVVGIYFASGSCPACRTFTQQLLALQQHLQQTSNREGSSTQFHVVVLSADDGEIAFKRHLAPLPWTAVPFHNTTTKARVRRRLRVQGQPALVLLDGATCQPITRGGHDHVISDPEGHQFPWRPRSLEQLLGPPLLPPYDDQEHHDDDAEVIGVYFSANWCPPCKSFSPQLFSTYKSVTQNRQRFKIVFVSYDRSAESFTQSRGDFPWWSVPWEDDQRRTELAGVLGVHGIPALVILDRSLRIISAEGRSAVSVRDPKGEQFPWRIPLVEKLTEKTASLQEGPCLLLFIESDEAGEEELFARECLLPTARRYLGAEGEGITEGISARDHNDISERANGLRFIIATDSDASDSLLSLLHLPPEVPILALLDLPSQRVYLPPEGGEVGPQEVSNFVEEFLQGTLHPHPLEQ